MRHARLPAHKSEDLSLAAARRRHVEAVLAVTGGGRSLAARLLGISLASLNAMLDGRKLVS